MYASLARCDVVTGLSKLSSMFIPASPAQRADVSCGQNRPQQLRQPLRQLLLRLRRHHRPHPGGQDQRAIRQCRCERQDQLPGPMFHRPPLAQRKALSARTPPREEGCVPIPAGDHNSPRPHKPHRRDPLLSARSSVVGRQEERPGSSRSADSPRPRRSQAADRTAGEPHR